ncbi:SNF7 family protein [Tieghemostelium lacteum]|uniref:SNF7 family protein n=1 Tax=Tieghemostelium lacteum TaxID=361077 RepID=A0A151Z346_TIELA|nr:SNF7 family protein [Tieghemostelium lacteum]|eukprot:KYQ88382.1 SNF7 family protein [Tieghemostelium lacteum]
MKLFAKKPQNTPQDAIVKLRMTLEMLEKRKKHLQEKADKEEQDARKFVQQKKKREALLCLKKKKNFQRECDNLEGSQNTLTQQIFALENAKLNMEILNAMREGANSLQSLHGNMTVDRVDEVVGDIETQMDIHRQISDAIQQPIGQQYDDEDDLLRELAELEQEDLDQQLLKINSPPSREPVMKFPEVGTTKPVHQSKEEEELKALTESLAM